MYDRKAYLENEPENMTQYIPGEMREYTQEECDRASIEADAMPDFLADYRAMTNS